MQKDTMATVLTRRPETYWLIVRSVAGSMEMLTVDLASRGKALAVFNFQEEAGRFSLLTLRTEWRSREFTSGKLAGMLSGSYAGIDFVVLDPAPEMVSQGILCLVGVNREHFVDRLVARAEVERAEPIAL